MKLIQCDACKKIVQFDDDDSSPHLWIRLDVVAMVHDDRSGAIGEASGPRLYLCPTCQNVTKTIDIDDRASFVLDDVVNLSRTMLRTKFRKYRAVSRELEADADEAVEAALETEAGEEETPDEG